MKVLVMGTSGTGKSYLAKELQKLDVKAVDADEIKGLHGWYNWRKERVPFPKDAGKEWLDNHEFLWDRKFLEEYLKEEKDIYFFGMSGNAFEMIDLFDKVYFLKVPDNMIVERLDHESRENPMGKTDLQKEAVIEYARFGEEKADKLKIQKIDGTLSSLEILRIIENNQKQSKEVI